MSTGKRQTFYFKNLDAIKEIAAEENMELNGSTFEELFWDRYVGEDETYKIKLKALYSGEQTLKQTILSILDTMAYTQKYKMKDNINFIKIVREIVGSADWFESNDNYTDYRLSNRETRLDNIADIFAVIVREIEHRKKMVNEPVFKDLNPWDIEVQDERYRDILNDETYYTDVKIEELKIKEAKLRKSFNDNITPGKALDLIIEYWDYFWNFTNVYEAVEYCVTLTEKLTDKPLLRKKMRTFFLNLNSQQKFMNFEIEHALFDAQQQHLNRSMAYAEQLKKIKRTY